MHTHGLINEDTLRAICALRNTGEFRVFIEGLRKQRDLLSREVEEFDGSNDVTNKLRGRGHELTQIFDVIEKSSELLSKVSRKPQH